MSAVVNAVVSVVESVVDAVGDVVEAVGDVVEKAVDTIGNVVEAVVNDPLPVLLSVAGSFVGIPPAITMGAITAARGGDLEDIALSMGTAYFAPSVGGAIASTVSETFIEAGLNETFSEVASNSISKGLVNGTVAEIKGGSFEDGFAGGLTGGLVAGGVGEVGSYVKDDVIALAQESGLDLKDATSLYNAGTRALSAGVTSEITGKGDFATSFTNSAITSGVDAGTRSLNSTIDEQFRTAATDWNEKDKEGEKIDTTVTGAGIPNDVVGQVTVSSIGVDATADTNLIDTKDDSASNTANVLADTTGKTTGETATSDITILPDTQLAQAPTGETVNDFTDIISAKTPTGDTVVSSTTDDVENIPASVVDIAESTPTTDTTVASTEPKGGLTALAEATTPAVDLTEVTKPAVVSEAPVSDNLLTAGLAQEKPEGALNTIAQTATPEDKMASSMGLKPTDITKPVVATVGNLFKQSLTQKRPTQRAPVRPTGGLQMASARPIAGKPTAPPTKMDIAKLIPIQKATPVAPPKTLASTAKLSPVTNIAGLTSLVKKTG
jgi:hypothetical protein